MTAEAATLLDGLTREAGLYRGLVEVSTEELSLVKSHELERATVLLTKKQQALEAIAEVEKTIRPLKEQWPAMKAKLPAGESGPFSAVLKDLSDLLERLIALERETETVLSGQIATVRKAWPAAGAEERAKKAYGGK